MSDSDENTIKFWPNNLNKDTLEHLSEEQRRPHFERLMHALLGISQMPGWSKEDSPDDFPLNAEGIAWVERYLLTFVKPNILQWDDRTNPVQVKHGVKTKKQSEIDRYAIRLHMAGLVHGQCLAQELGLHWAVDADNDSHLPLLARDLQGHLNPWCKPAKFCCFGDQDSLLGAVNIFRNVSKATKAIEGAEEDLIRRGVLKAEEVAGRQIWYSPDGEVDKILFMDKDRNVLARCLVVRSEAEIGQLVKAFESERATSVPAQPKDVASEALQ